MSANLCKAFVTQLAASSTQSDDNNNKCYKTKKEFNNQIQGELQC